MKVLSILNEAPVSPDTQNSFNNIYKRIASQVKGATGIDVSTQWVAGLLNQFHNFRYLNKIHKSHKDSNNENAARDTEARIVARDVLAKVGLLDKANGYLPKNRGILSSMRQYYAQAANTAKASADIQGVTRGAADSEYEDWYNDLQLRHRNFIDGLHELEPEALAEFKGIIRAKESKKGFTDRLYNFIERNPSAIETFRRTNIIDDNDALQMNVVEDLRSFLSELSPARLKDVMSKAAVYATKKITHDTHRAKNAVLKDLEKNPHGVNSQAIKVYNYISRRIQKYEDQGRAFRRFMDKLPMVTNSDGTPNAIGIGASTLFKTFGGKTITKADKDAAIKQLNTAYRYPASDERRAAKAATRGETINKLSDI